MKRESEGSSKIEGEKVGVESATLSSSYVHLKIITFDDDVASFVGGTVGWMGRGIRTKYRKSSIQEHDVLMKNFVRIFSLILYLTPHSLRKALTGLSNAFGPSLLPKAFFPPTCSLTSATGNSQA